MNATDEHAAAAADLLSRLRDRRPLIHHITNFVVMHSTANVTLCAGALPVMAHAPEEVEEMVGAAAALVLNLGTLWPAQVDAMLLAGHRANRMGIPIVLDPVGAGATRLRTESALRLLRELSIRIVRGNAAELAALAGLESLGTVEDAAEVALQFARNHGCTAAITGAVDVVTDGKRLLRVINGHPLMATITGSGCMATAVVAAFAAVERESVTAAASALACYGLAGEMAATKASGPGIFQMLLFDALAGLNPAAALRGVRMKEQQI
jgi:hydroxyethylthiazole kinase